MRAFDNITLSYLPVHTIIKTNVLTFSKEYKGGVVFLNWKPLTISTRIIGPLVHRIMADNGAFCDIIFKKTLDLLGDFNSYIKLCELGIRGFGNQLVQPYGMIRLALEVESSLGKEVCATRQFDFVIVDLLSTFNDFFSRTLEHEFGATSFSYYYSIKFPGSDGMINTIKPTSIPI